MKELLNAILERLVSKLPELKYVDENWGQLEYYPKMPVKFPCALVDVEVPEWGNFLERVQNGEAIIEITFAKQRIGGSSNAAPSGQKESNFEIYDIIKNAHVALHGWNPTPDSGRIKRIQTGRSEFNNGIKFIRMSVAVRLNDDSAKPEYIPVFAEMNIKNNR